ncbi:MAG: hypothetical protein SPI58_06025 [Candidatus Enteromonas sp.]|nr:hypothetical protein [Candidatus Enteromonas sp.]
MKNRKTMLFVLSTVALLGLAACGTPNSSLTPSEEESSTISSDVEESVGSEFVSESDSEPQVRKYAIIDDAGDHVFLKNLPSEAAMGEKITFSIEAAEPGYAFTGTVKGTFFDKSAEFPIAKNEDGTYSFKMISADVTIVAETEPMVVRLNYDLPANRDLAVDFYQKVDLHTYATAEYRAVAGVYQGACKDGTYDRFFRLTLGYDRTFVIVRASSEANLEVSPEVTFTGTYVSEDRGDGNYIITVTYETCDSGYYSSLTGEIYVTSNAEGRVVTAIDLITSVSGSYRYGFQTGSGAFIEGAKEFEEGTYRYIKCDGKPQYGYYQDALYVKPIANNYYEESVVMVDDTVCEKNEDGYYMASLPFHTATIKVDKRVRYSPIVIQKDSEYVDVRAYTRAEVKVDGEVAKDESGNTVYEYTEVTEAKYQDEIYFKIEVDEVEGFKFNGMRVRYGSKASDFVDTLTHASQFTQNADGYYHASWTKMTDMDYGMIATVQTATAWATGDDAAFVVTGQSRQFGSTLTSEFSVNEYGEAAFGTKKFFFGKDDYDPATGKVAWHAYQESVTYDGYYEGGLYVVSTVNTSTSINNVYFGVKNLYDEEETALPITYSETKTAAGDFAIVDVTQGESTKTVVLGDFDPETGTDDNGVFHDAITVHGNYELRVLNGAESYTTPGAVVDVMDGETVLATYKNYNSVLKPFVKGTAGTFTAEGLPTIVTDGFGGVTITANPGSEEETVVSAFLTSSEAAEEGKENLSVLATNADGHVVLYAATLDVEAKTYVAGETFGTVISGKNYRGVSINNTTAGVSGGSVYLLTIGEGDKLGTAVFYQGSSSTAYKDMALSSDGSITVTTPDSTNYKVNFTADGSSVIARHSNPNNSSVILTDKITATYASYFTFNKVNVAGGVLVEFTPSYSSYGTRTGHPFFVRELGNNWDIEFVDVTYAEGSEQAFEKEGARFSLTLDGEEYGPYYNTGTAIVADVSGTYVIDETTNLEIVGDKVTYNGMTKTFTFDTTTNTGSFTNLETTEEGSFFKTYEFVLDTEAMTATIEVVSSVAMVIPTIADEGSLSGYVWTQQEDGSWVSPGAFKSNTAWLNITCATSGTLTFDYQIGSEAGYDYLTIQTKVGDGSWTTLSGYSTSDKSSNSGVVSGSITLEVEAGTVVRVGYYKDSSGDKNGDTIVVSNVLIAPSAVTEE